MRWYTVITALRSAEAKRIFSKPGLHEAAKTNIKQSQTTHTHNQLFTLCILEYSQKRIVIQKSALQRFNVTREYIQCNSANWLWNPSFESTQFSKIKYEKLWSINIIF